MKKIYFLLLAVLFLAITLRFYQLGQTPISLEWDEVAIGYDAYSVLKTGRDQFGKFLPTVFRSLDDYKPPIYEYLTVLPVALFGLNSFAVRLPSALGGIIAVYLTYFLAKNIIAQNSPLQKYSKRIALVSALLLALSPWHLQFSRAAFEVNVSVMITMAAVYFFIMGLDSRNKFLFSAFLFGLNLFSYHSTRIISPLLLLCLFIFLNHRLPSKKTVLGFFLIFGIFFLAFIPVMTSEDAQIRFKATNIFNAGARYLEEKDLPKIYLDRREEDKRRGYELSGKIFHNQRLIYFDYDTLVKAFRKYLSHYDFEFLFIKGDAPLHHAPGFGLLYLWELPFLLIGITYLLFKGLNRYTAILLLWFLIAPIPAAVTRETPHAVRTELFLPTFQILTGIGLGVLLIFIKKERSWVSNIFVTCVSVLFAVNVAYYLHQYYIHTNFELSKNWMYGREEAVNFTESVKHRYEKVLVSQSVDQPYIFWLFYTKYPPQLYLKEGGTVSGGFAEYRNKFDKYEFRNFDYRQLVKTGKILLVGLPSDFPPDAKIVKTIYYLDGSKALLVAEN